MANRHIELKRSYSPLENNKLGVIIINICGNFYGSGALSGKMLRARIVENNKNYAYFRSGCFSKGLLALPRRVRKVNRNKDDNIQK